MTIDFQDVLVPYHNHGLRFEYPDIWEFNEHTIEGDVMLSVAASDTSFWLLRIIADCSPPPQVIQSCLEAFKEEYDDLEVERPDTSLAQMPASALDASFFCMDLMNSVGLRSVRTAEFTLLVWWQSTQLELEENEVVFEHMTRSVQIDSMLD